MAMINKGVIKPWIDERKYSKLSALRKVILFISVGLGLFLVSIIDFYSFVADISLLLIVGGVGFFIYYQMVLKRMDEKEE